MGRVENEEPGLRRIDKSRRAAQLEYKQEHVCVSEPPICVFHHGVD